MDQTIVQIQVFYELATTIGNQPNLEPMLRECLSAFLHKLNCSSGMFLHAESDDSGFTRLVPIVTIPRRPGARNALDAALRNVPERMENEAYLKYQESLPVTFCVDGEKRAYVVSLPEFGLLILVKAGEPFTRGVLHSLVRLNVKLSQASRFRLQSEETGKINEQLKREIEERLRAEAELKRVLEDLERRVAERTQELTRANRELEEALANVKTLNGLLPICSGCKKIRDDHGYWNQLESYIARHSEAMFTHSLCPDCIKRLYGDLDLPKH